MGNSETKKKISALWVLDIVMLVVLALILAAFIYLKATDRDMFLFGRVFDRTLLSPVFWIPAAAVHMIMWEEKEPGKKRKSMLIVWCILIAVITVSLAYCIYDDIENIADMETIALSDGNTVLLSERIDYWTGIEKRYELTYLDVYKINGLTAKKVGEIDESYFSNKCLSQDKYTYEYDETGKKLKIICEYGTYGDSVVRLKEEYDTGFWEEEFLLE